MVSSLVSSAPVRQLYNYEKSIRYSDRVRLAGIIYMHEISPTRMLGTSRKNFGMYIKLIGDDAAKNVILVATMRCPVRFGSWPIIDQSRRYGSLVLRWGPDAVLEIMELENRKRQLVLGRT